MTTAMHLLPEGGATQPLKQCPVDDNATDTESLGNKAKGSIVGTGLNEEKGSNDQKDYMEGKDSIEEKDLIEEEEGLLLDEPQNQNEPEDSIEEKSEQETKAEGNLPTGQTAISRDSTTPPLVAVDDAPQHTSGIVDARGAPETNGESSGGVSDVVQERVRAETEQMHKHERPVTTFRRSKVKAKLHSPRVYVGNLSYVMTSRDLGAYFEPAGEIVHVEIFTDKKGSSKGCAVIEFQTLSGAERAINMFNDDVVLGKKIHVREDRESGHQRPSSGRGGDRPSSGLGLGSRGSKRDRYREGRDRSPPGHEGRRRDRSWSPVSHYDRRAPPYYNGYPPPMNPNETSYRHHPSYPPPPPPPQYPPHDVHYPPHEYHYQHSTYPPPQGHYLPPQERYTPPQGHYLPPQGRYPPPIDQYRPPSYPPTAAPAYSGHHQQHSNHAPASGYGRYDPPAQPSYEQSQSSINPYALLQQISAHIATPPTTHEPVSSGGYSQPQGGVQHAQSGVYDPRHVMYSSTDHPSFGQ